MPCRRHHAEANGKAAQHRFGQRNLGQQDQHLPPAAQRLRHRLEIDLGLTRSGDAVEQEGLEPRANGRDQRVDGGLLRRAQHRGRKIGVGQRDGRFGDSDGLERARLDQAAQHLLARAGRLHQIGDAALTVADLVERGRALRRHPFRRSSCRAIFDDRSPALAQRHRWHHHAQHPAGWRQIIIRCPFDQAAQIRRQRRHIMLA